MALIIVMNQHEQRGSLTGHMGAKMEHSARETGHVRKGHEDQNAFVWEGRQQSDA